jgi:hypothetical protein
MGIAYITARPVMGAGAPVYGPVRASETVNTTTSNAVATIVINGGDYIRVVARTADVHLAINKTAATEPRDTIPAGTAIDIGPLKQGDVLNLIDVT